MNRKFFIFIAATAFVLIRLVLIIPKLRSDVSRKYRSYESSFPILETNIPLSPERRKRYEWDNKEAVSKNILLMYPKYLQVKNIKNLNETSNSNYSKLCILSSSRSNNSHVFWLGDTIKVRIDLYNGYGKAMRIGGDILRIWMIDPSNKASVAGYVIDHWNGTYTGYLQAVWKGKPQIKVSIASTKEHIGIVTNYIEKTGLLYNIFVYFKSKDKSEITLCSVIPKIHGHKEVCNFTTENFGMHWFCGKPETPGLSCNDWVEVTGSKMHRLSKIEVQLSRYHKFMTIKDQPVVEIKGDSNVLNNSVIPCNTRPRLATWWETIPTGFFYKAQWILRNCLNTFTLSKTPYVSCLKNHHIVLLGDSNIRSWFYDIQKRLGMKIITKRFTWNRKWHSLLEAENTAINTTMLWSPHEFPFYVGQSFSSKYMIKSIRYRLDNISIASGIKLVVVLHIYFHLLRISPDEFREHIRDARVGMVRLIQRYSNVMFFIKGPHSVTYFGEEEPVDFFRRIQNQIMYEEFKGLLNRIVYLDEWDITVASENVNIHPPHKIARDMLDTFMGYYCKENTFGNNTK